jgi:hypothetical protein
MIILDQRQTVPIDTVVCFKRNRLRRWRHIVRRYHHICHRVGLCSLAILVNSQLADRFEPDSKPAEFLDDSVFEKTGKIGGIDEEGEVIGLWRPSGRECIGKSPSSLPFSSNS